MKTARGTLARALDKPDPGVRFYLFYGRDEGQSRGHAERLLKGLGAERFDIPGPALKADPALLADEAAAIGLFGGKRALWVEPAGDEIVAAVDAVLEAAGIESPAIAIGGALRKTSPLVKLAESHPLALAHISYELDEREAERLVEDLARDEGLRLGVGIAARIAASAGNERGIIAHELGKIALYAGATPEHPKQIDRDILDEIGAGGESDGSRLGDLALLGDLESLSHELDIAAGDTEPVSVIRALQRRLLMLAPIRARVDLGARPHDAVTSAGKSVFWKDKDRVAKLVSLWESKGLARVLERSGDLERRLMSKDSPPPFEALEEELIAIARTARRR
ncbi:MAG TPA: DNA polymerase III subunit delta [Sphingomicrobium sp.]|nr:DNA polymerase III subunit delta [Sphingomicrobium sp.]